MTDNTVIFRDLACSDMVRKALHNHAKHQPIANDDRIDWPAAGFLDTELRCFQ